MTPPDTLLFDLDDTLIHPPADGDERLAAAFEAADVEPFFTVADFSRWISNVEGESPLDLRLKCFRGIAREKGRSEADAERVARAFEMPDVAEFTPADAATDVVTTLGQRGYSLALVTNGPEEKQREKLRALGLEDAFDATVFGTPERGLKPDREPFETALESVGVEPRDAVQIGDSLEADIRPAREMGLATVWVPPSDDADEPAAADVVVHDLEGLLAEPWTA